MSNIRNIIVGVWNGLAWYCHETLRDETKVHKENIVHLLI